jgi:hypothetical protein
MHDRLEFVIEADFAKPEGQFFAHVGPLSIGVHPSAQFS